jgi:hypothetical protein
MATRLKRWLVAALVALLTLLIAHWFDAGVLTDEQLRASHPGLLYNLGPVAHMLTAAGVVVLALAAWWSRSLLVGACYALVGGYLVFLPALYWKFGWVMTITREPGWDIVPPSMPIAPTTQIAPQPMAPSPIASTLADWYFAVSTGVTGAVFTLAAAMLLSGLVVIASVLRARRRGATGASPATAQTPQ